MSEAIRDVIIRISLENGESNFQLPETIRQSFESIRNYEQSFSNSASTFSKSIESMSRTANDSFSSTIGDMKHQIESVRDEIESVFDRYKSGADSLSQTVRQDQLPEYLRQTVNKSLVSGGASGDSGPPGSHPGIDAMRQQFADVRKEMEEARKAAEAGSDSFMAASISTGVLVAGVALLAAGLKTYSVIANETRDINQNYWSDLANSSLSTGQHTFGRLSRETSNESAIRGVRSIDLTDMQTAPAITEARREREQRIQAEQAGLVDHPLSVRQEVRSRIEGQGNRMDELLKSESRMEHLSGRLERIDTDETAINDRLALARREYEGTMRGIQSAKDNFQATRSGNIAGDWNRYFGDGTLGQASEDSYNPFGQMWDHSVAGETTLWDKFQHDKKLDITASNATASFEGVESQSAAEMVKNENERLSISREMSVEAQRRIGLIRDEQRESRLAAEAGREDLTNKMLKFGAADEGTKAALRNIQAKADSGAELNHQEIGLANAYGIDAAQQARKQSIAAAERPENASLFANQQELQKGREERTKEANSPKMQETVEKMEQILTDQGDKASEIVARVVDKMEHSQGLVELLETLERRISEQEAAFNKLLAKQQRWF